MSKRVLTNTIITLAILVGACAPAAPVVPAPAGESAAAAGPQKGGDMIVAYKDDLATLDPAIGYDWTNWPAIKMVFDGLLDYDSGTTLQPRLAESMPEVSTDGMVYTFKLRKGVKFHNGRELNSDDVVYSITRVIDPATGSPGSWVFTGIRGAQEMMDGSATSVSGIKALDANTVQFTLAKPDVTFLNKMAINFAFIVPKEVVEKEGENFGHNPIGTGPFKLQEWKSGEYLAFERNAEYFYQGLPMLDKVTIRVGLAPDVALLQLEKGEIQMMGDPPPGAEWERITADAAWKNRITKEQQVNTTYIAINVTALPFDNVKVRQALHHAIDKQRIVQLLNGRAAVANQILPPLMPGYDSSYSGFDYNPDKAKQLLAEAGFADGFETSIECISVDPQPKICESFQQDLAKVGVKLTINSLAAPNVIDDASNGRTPLVWSGGLAWTQDYPDPDDFYSPVLGCESNVPGGWNWSRYCNVSIDAKSKELLAMTDRTARLEAYKPLFKALMEDAAFLPVINGVTGVAHSEKLKGQPSLIHPEHYFMYETMWMMP